jgi:hypothetical protein
VTDSPADLPTLSYSSRAAEGELVCERTEEGVTITRPPQFGWTLRPWTLLTVVLLILGCAVMIAAVVDALFRWRAGQMVRSDVVIPAGVVGLVLLLALFGFLRQRFRRRGMHAVIAVRGDSLVLVTPERHRLTRAISLANVRRVEVTTIGMNSKLQSLGSIQVHSARDQRITVFRSCTVAELRWVCQIVQDALSPADALLVEEDEQNPPGICTKRLPNL